MDVPRTRGATHNNPDKNASSAKGFGFGVAGLGLQEFRTSVLLWVEGFRSLGFRGKGFGFGSRLP